MKDALYVPGTFCATCFFLPEDVMKLVCAHDLDQAMHLSIHPSIHPPIHPSIYISIFLSFYLFFYLSIYLSFYLSIYLSIYLCIYVIYLSKDKSPSKWLVTTSVVSCFRVNCSIVTQELRAKQPQRPAVALESEGFGRFLMIFGVG